MIKKQQIVYIIPAYDKKFFESLLIKIKTNIASILQKNDYVTDSTKLSRLILYFKYNYPELTLNKNQHEFLIFYCDCFCDQLHIAYKQNQISLRILVGCLVFLDPYLKNKNPI